MFPHSHSHTVLPLLLQLSHWTAITYHVCLFKRKAWCYSHVHSLPAPSRVYDTQDLNSSLLNRWWTERRMNEPTKERESLPGERLGWRGAVSLELVNLGFSKVPRWSHIALASFPSWSGEEVSWRGQMEGFWGAVEGAGYCMGVHPVKMHWAAHLCALMICASFCCTLIKSLRKSDLRGVAVDMSPYAFLDPEVEAGGRLLSFSEWAISVCSLRV